MKKKKMKKWIPDYIYCEGIYGKGCPWHKTIWYDVTPEMEEHIKNCKENYPNNIKKYLKTEKKYQFLKNHPYKHKREECQFGTHCIDACSNCSLKVSKCEYLNYIEYGPFPLGDKCKICNIRMFKNKHRIKNMKEYYKWH